MIQLTQQPHEAVQQNPGEPVRAIDPTTNAEYVLLRADIYDRLRMIFSDNHTRGLDAHATAIDVFTRDGWDDPQMDVYDSLPPSGPS